ncbi:hypothetical protein ETAA8_26550 [Anatilimnocola aggregata]|uniref:Trypsin-like peptidase domain-containing protein n=1 Tax=Anatilimnocola aggregata TaxID=2528021 RepID=A0A517YBF7_9BACT|nr:hypothetical protein [Anatilimnocola aggregata]QDU27567.1 hypothetical protein ETAA8_26550 [Anatilimnocola aggregata]
MRPSDGLFNVILDRLTPIMQSYSTPILAAYGGKVYQHATGTLFAFGSHRFLVTASHAIKQYLRGKQHYKDLVLLVENGAGKLVRLYGQYNATETANDTSSNQHAADGDDLDIAVWKLHEKTIDSLTGKSYLNRGSISISADVTSGVYFLVGYPTEWSSSDLNALMINLTPMPLITGPLEAPERVPSFNPNLHMLMDLDPPAPCPKSLEGISGCAVWRLSTTQLSPAWTPDEMKVVGIQTGIFSKHGAIKATKWKYVIRCLVQLVPDIRDAFKLWLPGEE